MMSTSKELTDRIDAALGRLNKQATAATRLNQKLTELQAKRDKDIAELDALVAELKPLVEEE